MAKRVDVSEPLLETIKLSTARGVPSADMILYFCLGTMGARYAPDSLRASPLTAATIKGVWWVVKTYPKYRLGIVLRSLG